jgi:hypothetical protein
VRTPRRLATWQARFAPRQSHCRRIEPTDIWQNGQSRQQDSSFPPHCEGGPLSTTPPFSLFAIRLDAGHSRGSRPTNPHTQRCDESTSHSPGTAHTNSLPSSRTYTSAFLQLYVRMYGWMSDGWSGFVRRCAVSARVPCTLDVKGKMRVTTL